VRTLVRAIAIAAVCLPLTAESVPRAQRELDYVLGAKPDIAAGASIYGTCAACHGPQGEGASDGTVPVIGGQYFTIIAKQIVDFRADVRRDVRMQHFADRTHLPLAQEIADVAAYVSTLKPLPREHDVTPEVLAHGARLYERRCERCHGAVAEGSEDMLVPRLGGQHLQYIRAQLDQLATNARPAMKRAHAMVQEMPNADVEAVAAYVSTLD
jgi:cytochrome c553